MNRRNVRLDGGIGGEEFSVGFDGGEDLIFEADLLDVLNLRVLKEEELVSEHVVWLLGSFLVVHGDS